MRKWRGVWGELERRTGEVSGRGAECWGGMRHLEWGLSLRRLEEGTVSGKHCETPREIGKGAQVPEGTGQGLEA